MTTSTTARSAARSAAPLITMGTTWAARKGLMKGYEAKTGKPAPIIRSRNASLMQKVLWAAALAAVVALVEVVVWQIIGEEE